VPRKGKSVTIAPEASLTDDFENPRPRRGMHPQHDITVSGVRRIEC
jgi:hypothetical protein